VSGLARRLGRGLIDQVPRDHWEGEAAFRRRRRVTLGTGVLGTVLLNRSLGTDADSKAFYVGTAAVAATWAVGGVASGRLHLGRIQGPGQVLRRPLITPVVTGVVAFGGFYGCAFVAQRIALLERAITSVMTYAHEGSTALVLATTLANGAAEEVFFRGALYAAIAQPHQVAVSTAAYTATTLSTKNPALVLAAAVMGTVFGLQRRASGGIQAPILTHLTWSMLMLRYLPPHFRRTTEACTPGQGDPQRH
jgi:membrane protease YdiL (CAAX protease family)